MRGRFCSVCFVIALAFAATIAIGEGFAIVPHLFERPAVSAPTVPANGDVNPYGVSFVPSEFPTDGLLQPGDVAVANFNNIQNLQGTGTTIVGISPNGQQKLFSQGAAVGLSTALGVLRAGFVIVGNLPSTDGSGMCTQNGDEEQNVGQGALTVFDRFGKVVKTIQSPSLLDGPWDLAVVDNGDEATLFVSNALSGTVTRLQLAIAHDSVNVGNETQIASGYTHRCDPNAFVVAPTGLALDRFTDTLYVASAGDNEIFAVANAGTRQTDHGKGAIVINDPAHLHGPLGLALAPNGDLISAQGDAVNPDPKHPSEITEYTAQGKFVKEFSIDSSAGSAFGLAITQTERGVRFAAVDDGLNVLDIWDIRSEFR